MHPLDSHGIGYRFLLTAAMLLASGPMVVPANGADPDGSGPWADYLRRYCQTCHSGKDAPAGIDFTNALLRGLPASSRETELALRQVKRRQMPPNVAEQPSAAETARFVEHSQAVLDQRAALHPQPGQTASIRRLNRREYQNAIRDMLDLEIPAASWLPADEVVHGFDTAGTGPMTPTLLDRYLTAAQRIARRAVGSAIASPAEETIRVPADITQEGQLDGGPWGTRGGILLRHHFPQNGSYEIQVRLARDRNEQVEGLREPHELLIVLDRSVIARFHIVPPSAGTDHESVDAELRHRIHVDAGPRTLTITFVQKGESLEETLRQPYHSHYNTHRHPRLSPAVFQISITGPFDPQGPGQTPSRLRIFGDGQREHRNDIDSTRERLAPLVRRAYRRPIVESDLQPYLRIARDAGADASFEAGIEAALTALLVSSQFLHRIEQGPRNEAAGTAHPVGDLELASRISFFLWSSIPDDELLRLAEEQQLRDPPTLRAQLARMLRDPRSESLATAFLPQWLQLTNLDSITPDGRLFPDFDHNLRQSMRREAELSFLRIIRDDRSLLELLRPGTIWLNERLARHYGITGVHGDHFRELASPDGVRRGGLLRQAGVLTVTSYATRTSPVLRGKWILENLWGSPPPPPPPLVPALDESPTSSTLSLRDRLSRHRADPACASCHQRIDPPGFSLENFDAVGRWRDREGESWIDARGGMAYVPDIEGVDGLERALLDQPELFLETIAEKLLAYALGRGIEYHDLPSIRRIVRQTREGHDRFSALLIALVDSAPFQMR